MPIQNIQSSQTGLVGVLPSLAYIDTTDTEAQVLTTGYLNHEVQNGATFQLPCIAVVSTVASPGAQKKSGWYVVSHVGANWSLISSTAGGSVVLPTIASHIAVYQDTAGTLSEDANPAINFGSIVAGSATGIAGAFTSFPNTANEGFLAFQANTNSAGNFATEITTQISIGQNQSIVIPDCGASSANFILSKSASVQTITGGLEVISGGLSAGSPAGSASNGIESYAPTAAKGGLELVAANNAGNTVTSITNNSMGQTTLISIPDPGNVNAQFLIAATVTPFVSGNLLKASGTAGVVADQGFAMKSVQGAAAAGGAAAQSFTDAFCTTGSVVIGNWVTQATPAEVITIAPGAGSFVVTSTANAGVGTFSYIITK
jgi:hypothetical protein